MTLIDGGDPDGLSDFLNEHATRSGLRTIWMPLSCLHGSSP
jgi:hypothetical protein